MSTLISKEVLNGAVSVVKDTLETVTELFRLAKRLIYVACSIST